MESSVIQGLILAGGQSSRMGRDKALLPINGRPLLYHLTKQMSAVTPSVTVAIGSAERELVYRESLEHLGLSVQFVSDHISGCGPLSGLHAGLSAMQSGYAFVMACDMPRLSESMLEQLRGRMGEGADAIHFIRQPFHALYHTNAISEMENSLKAGDYRLMSLLTKLRSIELSTRPSDEAYLLTNLNTPEAYNQFVGRDGQRV